MFAQAWNGVANGRHATLNSRKLVQNDKQLTKNMFYKFIWCISNFTIMKWDACLNCHLNIGVYKVDK